MMSTDERLAYMADQIMRNFAARGHDAAVVATADHIAHFWDPRMKALAFGMVEGGTRPSFMTESAFDAITRLRDGGAPPPQTPATEFNDARESGHSDAG